MRPAATGGGTVLRFGVVTAGGRFRPLLALEGLSLRRIPGPGGAPVEVLERFARPQRSGHLWRLRAGRPETLEARLRLEDLGAGRYAVRVRLRVGLETRLLSAALAYRWLAGVPVRRIEAPALCPLPGDRADERSFGTPLLLAATGNFGVALLPDPRLRAAQHRLPWFLAPGPGPRLLVGLGRSRRLGDGRAREEPVPALLAGEELSFGHELLLTGDGRLPGFRRRAVARAAALAAAVRAQGLEDPRRFEARQRTTLEAALRRLHPVPGLRGALWRGSPQPAADPFRAAPLADGAALDLAGDGVLEEALALLQAAGRPDGGRYRRAAEAIFRTALAAPKRGGLFATHARVRGGRLHWREPGAAPFASGACARVGLLLAAALEAGGVPSEEGAARLRDLARFLAANLHPRGGLPAHFDRELVPVRDAGYLGGPGLADCARFLALRARGPRERSAAAALLAALARRAAAEALPLAAPPEVPARRFDFPGTEAVTAAACLAGLAALERADFPAGVPPSVPAAREALLSHLLGLVRTWPGAPPGEPRLLAANHRLPAGRAAPAGECAWLLARAWLRWGSAALLELAAWIARGPARARDLHWLGRLRREIGDVVFDARSRRAAAFVPVRAAFPPGTGRDLLLEADAEDPPQLRVRLRLPKGGGTFFVNGRPIRGRRAGADLLFEARPEAMARLEFSPPPRHDRRLDLPLRATLVRLPGEGPLRAWFEWRPGPPEAWRRIPAELRPAERPAVRLLQARIPAALLAGFAQIEVRAAAERPGRGVVSPPAGAARVALGEELEADFGSPSARAFVGGRPPGRPQPAADGRGLARLLPPGTELYCRFPVPPERRRVRIRLRYAGAGELQAGPRVVALPAPGPRAFADLELHLSTRRLWAGGRLALVLRAGRARALAPIRLRLHASGRATPPAALGADLPPAHPAAAALELELEPHTATGAPPLSREALRLRLFGRGDPGAPSLAGLLARWTNGRVRLRGRVGPWRPGPRSELTGRLRPAGGPAAPLALPLPPAPERWASLLLAALAGAPPPAAQAWPAAAAAPLGPAPPALDLQAFGWLPGLRVRPGTYERIELAPALEGGYLLSLPEPGGAARGRLYLEARRRPAGPAPLVLRAFAEPAAALAGRAAARFVLPPEGPWPTPQGELCWRAVFLPGGPDDETLVLRLGSLQRELLGAATEVAHRTSATAAWRALLPGEAGTLVQRGDRGLALHPPTARGAGILLRGPLVVPDGGARLFLRWRRPAPPFELRLALPGSPPLVLATGGGRRGLECTLPPGGGERGGFRLEARRTAASEAALEDLALTLAPAAALLVDLADLAPPERRVALTPVLADGRRYAPALRLGPDEAGRARLDLPLAVPPGGGLLRLRVGHTAGDPPRLELRFKPAGGHATPLLPPAPTARGRPPLFLTHVLDLAPLEGRKGFLLVTLQGSHRPLYILDASIRRH